MGAPMYTPLSTSVGRNGRGPSVGNVQSMLNDLVQLSHSIATYLEQEPASGMLASGYGGHSPATSTTGAVTGGGAHETAALKAQEIERIVGRVQTHFKAKVEALERENDELRRQLAEARAGRVGRGAMPERSVRRGIEAQEDALTELDKTWAAGDSSAHPDVEQLRRVLLAEKRQRLLVEEQTQSLTEQHAKVVSTLERRLRKQEDQLRDLIHAVDRSYNVGGNPGGSRSQGPSSPTAANAAPAAVAGGLGTPRRLLRQQLAQHQQTQRALQQYREHIAPTAHVDQGAAQTLHEDAQADDDDYLDSLGLADVRATLQALQRSAPPTVTAAVTGNTNTGKELATSPVATVGQQQSSGAPQNTSGSVDDIGAYLDSITKELETLGADDEFL